MTDNAPQLNREISTTLIARSGRPTIAVHILGQEPTMLLVHGATATAASWFQAMPAVAGMEVTPAAIDLSGHGQSQGFKELQSFRIRDYVSDVLDVLARWPSIRILAGHSMGGLIGQLVAAQVDLDKLVLVASSPVGGMRGDGLRMARTHPWTFVAAGIRHSFKRLYKSPRVTRSLLFHPDSSEEMVVQFMGECQEESWIAGNEMNTLMPVPHDVRCPVTVIAGQSDFMVGQASSERTALAYSTKPLVLAGCAHMVPIEAKPEVFARAMVLNDA